MSYYESLSCPVCSRAFTPNEDIVVCPQCGLPHHRDCWKSIGQCYASAKHGTDQQWSRDAAPQQAASPSSATNACPNCGTDNAEYAEFCSRCGTPLSTNDWHSAAPQSSPAWGYGSYADHYAEETIGDVKSEDLAAMVGSNELYYLPRFRRIERGVNGGWNWCAFLISPYWLFYRKQYLLGAIYLFVALATGMLCSIVSAPAQLAETEAEMLIATQNMQNHFLFYPCFALVAINLALAVLLGWKGNQFYYNHCRNKILSIKEKTPDLSSAELRSYGGVSIGLVILVYVISQIVTMLLTYFLSGLFYV